MLKTLSLSLVILALVVSVGFSQTAETDPLTNQDVIEMVKAGLSDTVIIAKITASRTKFVTDIPRLKVLKAESVSEAVVTKMIDLSASKTSLQEIKAPEPSLKSDEYIAAEKIMSQLRRLDNAVEIGTSMQNFSEMLVETKSILDENRIKIKGEEFLRRADLAFQDYNYSAAIWNAAANGGWNSYASKLEPGRTLITKYKVPVKISLWTAIPVMTGVRYVWLAARENFNFAKVAFDKLGSVPKQ